MARAAFAPVYTEVPSMGVDGRTVLAGARAPVITDGRVGDFWIDTSGKKLYGPKNAGGWPDRGLIRGAAGWYPLERIVSDGSRRVVEIYDWSGGEGVKPDVGYKTAAGAVTGTIADAVDMRGPEGPEMLIANIDPGNDDVTYDTMIAVAVAGGDNVRQPIKNVLAVGGLLHFRTAAEAEAASIPASVGSIQIGNALIGDGGDAHVRKRVDEEPEIGPKHRSADRFLPDGASDSANGGWWAYVDTSERSVKDSVYSTRQVLASASVASGLGAIFTSGRDVAGIGAALHVEVDNAGPLQPGQFQTNFLQRRWENAEDTITPAMFADITEMFAFTKAQIQAPAGSYEFNAPIATRAGAVLRAEDGAVFRPTFQPVGTDRATPLFALGAGASVSRLDVRLVAGINTIRKVVQVGDGADIGMINVESADLNNNRTESGSTDLISGGIIISGSSIRIGRMRMLNFDRGWSVVDGRGVLIGTLRNLATVMGGYVHGTTDLHILSGYTTGCDPHAPNAFGRGIMTPGANSLVLAGCADSSFSNWFAADLLEHGIRVGGQASGTSTPNHRIAFNNVKIYRPYGCGFKCDDGDAFAIKRISVNGLYTEDVGKDNWYGTPGYENWSAGGVNNPSLNTDGNKVACAIRNSEHVQIASFMNRANVSAYSGHMGFWVERSQRVFANGVDTQKSRDAGVCVQSGGATSPEEITLDGVVTRFNGGAGLKYNAAPSDTSWRGVVVTGLVSESNTGYGIEVTGRNDGGTPFATWKSSISGRSSNNTAGAFLVDDDVRLDMDFILSLEERMAFTPILSLATPGDSSFAYTVQTGRLELRGSLGYVEINLAFTPTIGAGSGNLRVGALPMAAASALNVVGLIETNSAFSNWNSRVELVPTVQNGATHIEIRGLAAGVGTSPIGAGNLTGGVAHTLKLAGHYRVF